MHKPSKLYQNFFMITREEAMQLPDNTVYSAKEDERYQYSLRDKDIFGNYNFFMISCVYIHQLDKLWQLFYN